MIGLFAVCFSGKKTTVAAHSDRGKNAYNLWELEFLVTSKKPCVYVQLRRKKIEVRNPSSPAHEASSRLSALPLLGMSGIGSLSIKFQGLPDLFSVGFEGGHKFHTPDVWRIQLEMHEAESSMEGLYLEDHPS